MVIAGYILRRRGIYTYTGFDNCASCVYIYRVAIVFEYLFSNLDNLMLAAAAAAAAAASWL